MQTWRKISVFFCLFFLLVSRNIINEILLWGVAMTLNSEISEAAFVSNDDTYQVSISGYQLAEVPHGKRFYVYTIDVKDTKSYTKYSINRRYSEFNALHRAVWLFIYYYCFLDNYKYFFYNFATKIRLILNHKMLMFIVEEAGGSDCSVST